MANGSCLRVLLVADGSGGHLIPALQVARQLAQHGAQIQVWYAQRQQLSPLTTVLTSEVAEGSVAIEPIPIGSPAGLLERLWHGGQLWRRARRCFETFAPDVVVGFGGWVSAPVVLAARLSRPRGFTGRRNAKQAGRRRRIGCLLHEQNVAMGRTNRWLMRWVDRVAVSFPPTRSTLNGAPSVVTGLPVRQSIGQASRSDAAARFGFAPDRPTLLILGGSQGARAINRLMIGLLPRILEEERARWQIIHLTGFADARAANDAYAEHRMQAWVAPFLAEMADAYAQADLVVGRAGASTIAELACCGLPALLIPYPHAGGHQRANARLVEMLGGGVAMEESEATPERLLAAIRRILSDQRLRRMMGTQMRRLQCADAAERLTDVIIEVGGGARGSEARYPQAVPGR